MPVYVHRRGARHLVDPSRLLASARRVFGDDLDQLFGPMTPIPEESLRILDGGERVGPFEVLYTPGHASHHVTYFHDDGSAFPGDVAAVWLGSDTIVPPTPPPDINLDLWRQSVDQVGERRPTSLSLPHFGLVSDPRAHLAGVREALARHEELARGSCEDYVAAVSAHVGRRQAGRRGRGLQDPDPAGSEPRGPAALARQERSVAVSPRHGRRAR